MHLNMNRKVVLVSCSLDSTNKINSNLKNVGYSSRKIVIFVI